MLRSKRLILTAHCILNQNAVIRDWERAPGAFNDIIKILLEHNIGIIQMPCPEFTYQGEARPPREKREYDTEEYRAHCRKLAEGVAVQVKEYAYHGYEITGMIGIQGSPTCDTKLDKGIFMEELYSVFLKEEVNMNTFDIPEDYLEGHGDQILEDFKKFIQESHGRNL